MLYYGLLNNYDVPVFLLTCKLCQNLYSQSDGISTVFVMILIIAEPHS